MGRSWALLGDIERYRLNLDKSEEFFKKALELFEQAQDSFRIARTLSILGGIARRRGDLETPENFYKQSLKLREELGDFKGIATSIGCLGALEMYRGKLEQAEIYLREALSKMEVLGMMWNIADTNFDFAILFKKRCNFSLAEEHYEKAQDIFTQLGAKKDLERIKRIWEEEHLG